MVATFNEALDQAARKRVDKAVDDIKEELAMGSLSLEEYRRKAGMIAGLRLAIDLIDEAKTDLMRR